MAKLTKVKTRTSGDQTEILVLVNHPMETGRVKDKKTGELKPAHYIQTMTFEVNGTKVAEASLGPAVSKNPLTSVAVKGAKPGDKVKVSWSDNKGENGGAETAVS
ncbi:MAG: thiosulfate oxidation carrier complex protein SoxZ [Gammaproteobacteria bacterium]|jgi:sulfur-oxidizing protein SoxZ|nr:thiosulfate oxidation carrier complex protein SoxZ [Gammaproteobacteria bacterium]